MNQKEYIRATVANAIANNEGAIMGKASATIRAAGGNKPGMAGLTIATIYAARQRAAIGRNDSKGKDGNIIPGMWTIVLEAAGMVKNTKGGKALAAGLSAMPDIKRVGHAAAADALAFADTCAFAEAFLPAYLAKPEKAEGISDKAILQALATLEKAGIARCVNVAAAADVGTCNDIADTVANNRAVAAVRAADEKRRAMAHESAPAKGAKRVTA